MTAPARSTRSPPPSASCRRRWPAARTGSGASCWPSRTSCAPRSPPSPATPRRWRTVTSRGEQVPAAAAVVRQEAGRLQRRVEDLLALARLEADDFTLNAAPVDLGEVVRAAAAAAAPRARAAGRRAAAAGPAVRAAAGHRRRTGTAGRGCVVRQRVTGAAGRCAAGAGGLRGLGGAGGGPGARRRARAVAVRPGRRLRAGRADRAVPGGAAGGLRAWGSRWWGSWPEGSVVARSPSPPPRAASRSAWCCRPGPDRTRTLP